MIAQSSRGIRLAVVLFLALALGHEAQAKSRKGQWVAAWGTSQQGLAPATETITNGTVRMIVRPTLSGAFVRVRIDNTFGTAPLTIGAASFAVRINGAQLVPGSSRPLTFSGSTTVTIPAGGGIYTDGLPYAVNAWEDFAVSVYVPGTAVPSRHGNARKTSFFTPAGAGDRSADETATAFTNTTTSMHWVAAVDVFSTSRGAVVFLGDSITDGTATTTDGHDRWHDVLFLRRLLGNAKNELGFVNEGIGGNRVVVTPTQGSPAAVERLDRDVLSRSGIVKVVFFEGTNDIVNGVNAADLIAGMKQIVDRVHAQQVKIVGATIIPRHNAAWTPQMTQYRHLVNDWIQHQARLDGVIDFDKVMRDVTNPDLMNPILDFGDHVHPNPYGYLRMGRAIDMSLIDGDGDDED
jgi:lysophospholipase L1-like esterase